MNNNFYHQGLRFEQPYTQLQYQPQYQQAPQCQTQVAQQGQPFQQCQTGTNYAQPQYQQQYQQAPQHQTYKYTSQVFQQGSQPQQPPSPPQGINYAQPQYQQAPQCQTQVFQQGSQPQQPPSPPQGINYAQPQYQQAPHSPVQVAQQDQQFQQYQMGTNYVYPQQQTHQYTDYASQQGSQSQQLPSLIQSLDQNDNHQQYQHVSLPLPQEMLYTQQQQPIPSYTQPQETPYTQQQQQPSQHNSGKCKPGMSIEEFLKEAYKGYNWMTGHNEVISSTEIHDVNKIFNECMLHTKNIFDTRSADVERYGLTYEDVCIIAFYTYSYPDTDDQSDYRGLKPPYSIMNEALRNRDIETFYRFRGFFYKLFSVLQKFPRYYTPSLYRGIEKSCECNISDKLAWDSFSSASINKDEAEEFAGKKGTVFVIKGLAYGYDIHFFSMFETEQEILMDPFIELVVKDKRENVVTVEVDGMFPLRSFFNIQVSDPKIEDYNKLVPRNTGDIQGLLARLDEYATRYTSSTNPRVNEEMAQLCCIALVNSASNIGQETHIISNEIIQRNGLNVAMKALRTFANDPDVCRNIIELFSLIAVRYSNVPKVVDDPDVIKAIIETTERYIDFPYLCECTCRFIKNIISCRNGAWKGAIEKGVMSIVIKTIKKYAMYTDVMNTVSGTLNAYMEKGKDLDPKILREVIDAIFENRENLSRSINAYINVFKLFCILGMNNEIIAYMTEKDCLVLCNEALLDCIGKLKDKMFTYRLVAFIFDIVKRLTAANLGHKLFKRIDPCKLVNNMFGAMEKYINNRLVSENFILALHDLVNVAEQMVLNERCWKQKYTDCILKILDLYAFRQQVANSVLTLLHKIIKRNPYDIYNSIERQNSGIKIVSAFRCHITKENNISTIATDLLVEIAKDKKTKQKFVNNGIILEMNILLRDCSNVQSKTACTNMYRIIEVYTSGSNVGCEHAAKNGGIKRAVGIMNKHKDDTNLAVIISNVLLNIISQKKVYVHMYVLAGGLTLLYEIYTKKEEAHETTREFTVLANKIRDICLGAFKDTSYLCQIPIHSVDKKTTFSFYPRMRAKGILDDTATVKQWDARAYQHQDLYSFMERSPIKYPEIVYNICSSVLERNSTEHHNYNLSSDEICAIALYTFDYADYNSELGYETPFMLINDALAERSPEKMSSICGLLYPLMSGLSKIPKKTHTLYLSCRSSDFRFRRGAAYKWTTFKSASTSKAAICIIQRAFDEDNYTLTLSGLSWGYDISAFSLCTSGYPEIIIEPEVPITFINGNGTSLNFLTGESRLFPYRFNDRSPFYYNCDKKYLNTGIKFEDIDDLANCIRSIKQVNDDAQIITFFTIINSVVDFMERETWRAGKKIIGQGLVSHATHILNRRNDCYEVVRLMCEFFAVVTLDRDSFPVLLKEGTIDLLIRTLRKYSKIPEICVPILDTIENAFICNVSKEILFTDSFRDLISTIVKHNNSSSCDAISLSSSIIDKILSDKKTAIIFIDDSLIEPFIEALKTHLYDDPVVTFPICKMLVNFSFYTEGEAMLVSNDVLFFLIKLLNNNINYIHITENILRPLSNLLYIKGNASIGIKEGLVETLFKIIEFYTSNRDNTNVKVDNVIYHSFKCYINILNNDLVQASEITHNLGKEQKILDIFKKFKKIPGICTAISLVLEKLMLGVIDGAKQFSIRGIVNSLVSALAEMWTDTDCCMAICNALYISIRVDPTGNNGKRAVESRAIQLLMTIATRGTEEPQVGKACRIIPLILSNAGLNDREVFEYFVKPRYVQSIFEVYGKHKKNKFIAEHFASTLKFLVQNPCAHEELNRNDAIAALKEIIGNYSDNNEVIKPAHEALDSIKKQHI